MRETVEASKRQPGETRKAAPVIAATVFVAALAIGVVVSRGLAPSGSLSVGLVLAGLGVLTEFLAHYEKGKAAVGSASLIPYAAALLVLPDWRPIVAVSVAQCFVQAWHRRSLPKSVFNIAQLSLALSTALMLQQATRGSVILGGSDFTAAMVGLIVPAAASVASQVLVNAICVAAVIWAVSGSDPLQMIRSLVGRLGWVSGLHVVVVVYLAWLSVNLGWVGALGMALPIVALRQLTKTAVELTNVTEELLDLMVAAIEARDPYTSGHSKRVAATAVKIARAMKLKPEQVERVQVAALLHDVGKINEEFARILAKEGRLTPEEWEIMKRHPVRSAELVGLVSSLKDVVPAVRHHHENWDGTGYPDGKRGDQIPLASRIIMFADTLDAITTDRPYRKALDPDEARREFIKFRGKQFDPDICDVVVDEQVWADLYRDALGAKAQGSEVAVA